MVRVSPFVTAMAGVASVVQVQALPAPVQVNSEKRADAGEWSLPTPNLLQP